MVDWLCEEKKSRMMCIALTICPVNSNRIWRYPTHEDIHNAEQKQILNVSVQGNLMDMRNSKFTLNNEKEIEYPFKNNFVS